MPLSSGRAPPASGNVHVYHYHPRSKWYSEWYSERRGHDTAARLKRRLGETPKSSTDVARDDTRTSRRASFGSRILQVATDTRDPPEQRLTLGGVTL